MKPLSELFSIEGQVCIITGGAGLLGQKHAEVVKELGGIPVILDINQSAIDLALKNLGGAAEGYEVDITNQESVKQISELIVKKYKKIDILINNAASNPTMNTESSDIRNSSRIENMSIEDWNKDISVGLTGAFLCSRTFGYQMSTQGKGVILNIASDLALIGPDQRLYKKEGLLEENQPVKPVTYSVVKSGLIGLTKYLSTYWNENGVRANALVPGGVFDGQSNEFVQRLSKLIPLGRMAEASEYKSSVAYLISDASSYMTGSVVVVDGGRTTW
jgi:NAD(P)-dependent dehydrogenase (short-subunit alcohol dehydrogenase family)